MTTPVEQRQPIEIDADYQRAFLLYNSGQLDEARSACRAILAWRPRHKASLHLLATLDHGARHIPFTAMHLSNPFRYHIGDWCYGAPKPFPHSNHNEPTWLRLGSYSTIAHETEMVLGSYHRQDWLTIFPFSSPQMGTLFPEAAGIPDFSWSKGSIHIGSDVWIGLRCIILSGVTIGHGAVVGAGSVITRDIAPYEIWAGNPARFQRLRFGPERVARLLALRWWDWPKDMVSRHAHLLMQDSDDAITVLEQAKRSMVADLNRHGGRDRFVTGATGVIRVGLPPTWQEHRPTVLLLNGSGYAIDAVALLATAIDCANTVTLDLPGFGQSWRTDEVSIGAMVEEILPALQALMPQQYHIVGAGFCGAVGLALARRDPRCRQVIMIDTALSTLKLWQNQDLLRRAIYDNSDDYFFQQFCWHIWGVSLPSCAERSYWDLLENHSAALTMIGGASPMPPRGAMGAIGSHVDDEDLARLVGLGVHCVRMAGGHDLANDATVAVADVIAQRLAALAL